MPCNHFWSLTRETTCINFKGRNSISLWDLSWKLLEPLKINPKLFWEEWFMENSRPGRTSLYFLTISDHSKLHVLVSQPCFLLSLLPCTCWWDFQLTHRPPERKRPSGTVHSSCDRWRGKNKFDTSAIATEAQWPRLPWLFYLPVSQALTLLKDQTSLCLFITLILFSTQLYYLFRIPWERLSERLRQGGAGCLSPHPCQMPLFKNSQKTWWAGVSQHSPHPSGLLQRHHQTRSPRNMHHSWMCWCCFSYFNLSFVGCILCKVSFCYTSKKTKLVCIGCTWLRQSDLNYRLEGKLASDEPCTHTDPSLLPFPKHSSADTSQAPSAISPLLSPSQAHQLTSVLMTLHW